MAAAKPNVDLVERFYHEMWNRFATEVIPEIAHPDIRFRGSLGQEKRGYQGLSDYVEFIRTAFPDFHNRIVETITEGNKIFARLVYSGTHRGEVFGIPGTGRRFEYAGAAVFTVREDRIAEVWVLGDIHGLLLQLRGEPE